MMRPAPELTVYLCVAPVDMRKQAASLEDDDRPDWTENCLDFSDFRLPSDYIRRAWTRFYFPMQKVEKMRPRRSSEVNSPVISARHC